MFAAAGAGDVPGHADAWSKAIAVRGNQACGNALVTGIKQGFGCGWENGGLPSGDPQILQVVFFGVRRRHFVPQPVVNGQPRRNFPGILRVEVEGLATQIAREIAASLQKENRLAEQEAGERIVNRKCGEHKETVGGDALEYIDLSYS